MFPLLILLTLAIGWLSAVVWLLACAFDHAADATFGRAAAAFALGLLLAGLPWISWTHVQAVAAERAKALRVPAPLNVARTEYAVEKSWGIGGPGDSETGFVVYRLEPESVAWLREQGADLTQTLDAHGGDWLSTPIKGAAGKHPWHSYDGHGQGYDKPHRTGVDEYLDQYGYAIDVAPAWVAEADRLMNARGSVYRYGRGGSVALVSPATGRVYFFYAG